MCPQITCLWGCIVILIALVCLGINYQEYTQNRNLSNNPCSGILRWRWRKTIWKSGNSQPASDGKPVMENLLPACGIVRSCTRTKVWRMEKWKYATRAAVAPASHWCCCYWLAASSYPILAAGGIIWDIFFRFDISLSLVWLTYVGADDPPVKETSQWVTSNLTRYINQSEMCAAITLSLQLR